MSQYFVRRAGRVDGPWNFDRLQSEVRLKKLSKFHEVSSDGSSWSRADQIPDLFETRQLARRSKQSESPADPVVDEEIAAVQTSIPSPNDQPRVWYIAIRGEPVGPYSSAEIRDAWIGGRLESELAWREGFANWLSLREIPEFSYWYDHRHQSHVAPNMAMHEMQRLPYSMSGLQTKPYVDPIEIQNFAKKKISAGVFGIMLGGFGIHKFILGLNSAGTIMLVVWLVGLTTGMCVIFPLFATIAMNIIGFVEGIIYLTKNDEDFYETYAVKKKEWF